ncbi:MAG TPA: 50S ribosomal protein L18 [bacterium]|nr:50S ribosomal protein L18 [bacterium]
MAKVTNVRSINRTRRHHRIRSKVNGTEARPRLCVFRSLKHVYAQLVDDNKGITIASASTLDSSFGEDKKSRSNIKFAKEVGKKIAQIAKEKNISEIVFDKSGYKYHGKIKAIAEAARESGLKF